MPPPNPKPRGGARFVGMFGFVVSGRALFVFVFCEKSFFLFPLGGKDTAIEIGRPMNVWPSFATAPCNAASCENSTYANPRGFPVVLSITIRAVTVPSAPSLPTNFNRSSSKKSSSSFWEAWKGRFLQNAVVASLVGNSSLYFSALSFGSSGSLGCEIWSACCSRSFRSGSSVSIAVCPRLFAPTPPTASIPSFVSCFSSPRRRFAVDSSVGFSAGGRFLPPSFDSSGTGLPATLATFST
mmetsp:Transcript_8061/g.30210  ORF Transcript_8061/g.30210 Transcript_8061/m.30210 type:complete len:240 (+) Transcript_8061:172-891(+)